MLPRLQSITHAWSGHLLSKGWIPASRYLSQESAPDVYKVYVEDWGVRISSKKRLWLYMAMVESNPGTIQPAWGWILAETTDEALMHIDPEMRAITRSWMLLDVIENFKDIRIQNQADAVLRGFVDKLTDEK